MGVIPGSRGPQGRERAHLRIGRHGADRTAGMAVRSSARVLSGCWTNRLPGCRGHGRAPAPRLHGGGRMRPTACAIAQVDDLS